MQLERPTGIRFFESFSEPRSVCDRNLGFVTRERLVDDHLEDHVLRPDCGEDRWACHAGSGGDVLDRGRGVTLR